MAAGLVLLATACGSDDGRVNDSAGDSAGDGITAFPTTPTDSASGNADASDDDDEIKLDLPNTDFGVESCAGDGQSGGGGGEEEFDFSYIWITNSGEGTVSKINTRTLVEEGGRGGAVPRPCRWRGQPVAHLGQPLG